MEVSALGFSVTAISTICIAALAFLTIALALNVSITRSRTRIMIGYPNDPAHPLYKAVRAHGNTTEYAPILMVLIYVLSQHPIATWVVWSMICVTFSRFFSALGLSLSKTLEKPSALRAIGALGTYLFGFALCFALALQTFGH